MTRIGFAYNQKPDPVVALSTSRSGPRRQGAEIVEPSLDDEYAEWDTPETIAAVEQALAFCGEVVRLEADETFPERLREARPDIVFNIAEGREGPNRESHVPAICEFFGVPYTGSDPFTLSLCLDKARTKEVLAYRGVPTPPFIVIRDRADSVRALRALRFPVFVKPVHEGSSKGVFSANLCRTPDELDSRVTALLHRYSQPVIAEEFLPGDEFTCGVIGNGSDARVLPIVALCFKALPNGAAPIYGFEAKWIWDTPAEPLDIFECPAPVSNERRAAIERVTLDAYHALGCRDWSRIDVRLDAGGNPQVLEVNPLPGILPDPAENSCLPKAARVAGMSYDELIQACLLAAARRQGVRLAKRGRARRRAAA